MAKKTRVCKICGKIVEDEVKNCPMCTNNSFIEKYKGRILILDEKSEVGKITKKSQNGIYAIKY